MKQGVVIETTPAMENAPDKGIAVSAIKKVEHSEAQINQSLNRESIKNVFAKVGFPIYNLGLVNYLHRSGFLFTILLYNKLCRASQPKI